MDTLPINKTRLLASWWGSIRSTVKLKGNKPRTPTRPFVLVSATALEMVQSLKATGLLYSKADLRKDSREERQGPPAHFAEDAGSRSETR